MADEITDEDIATAALQPGEMESPAGRVRQRTIDELQKAQDRVAGNTAAGRNHGGLRITKLIPGGAD